MNKNLPVDKQDIDNIYEYGNCFKCNGKLEIIHEINPNENSFSDDSWLRCIKCGQRNNWWEKKEWEKKGKK